jgi:hypothetical protein
MFIFANVLASDYLQENGQIEGPVIKLPYLQSPSKSQ